MSEVRGSLALIGGGEWRPGCTFDADLLAASGTEEVLVIPTAGAYAQPERLVAQAAEWFGPMGARVEGLMVVARNDAQDEVMATIVRRARFLYLAGESSLHLVSVMKNSVVWAAVEAAWQAGATLAASGGAAMAVTDPMIDARGGGLTLGLGLVSGFAVMPNFGDNEADPHGDKIRRTTKLAPPNHAVVGLPASTALIGEPSGWRVAGAHPEAVGIFLAGERTDDLSLLP